MSIVFTACFFLSLLIIQDKNFSNFGLYWWQLTYTTHAAEAEGLLYLILGL